MIGQNRKLKEISGVLILFLNIFLLLSLLTNHPEDPSGSAAATNPAVSNFTGRIGAALSDWLFTLLGLGAFLLLIPLIYLTFKLLRARSLQGEFGRFCGFMLLLLGFLGLFELLLPKFPGGSNFTPGGIIGGAYRDILVFYVNTGGAFTLLVTLTVVGFLLMTTHTLVELVRKFRARLEPRPETEVEVKAGPPVPEEDGTVRQDQEYSFPDDEMDPDFQGESAQAGRSADYPVAAKKSEKKAAVAAPAIPISRLEFRRDESAEEPDALTSTVLDEGEYTFPPSALLDPPCGSMKVDDAELMEKAQQIIRKYGEFGIDGSIDAIHPGPVVTLFEYKPAPGVKYSRMVSLVDDLCLGLKAESIRVDRIPGKSTVGIEVPNAQRQTIFIRELLESKEYLSSRSRLTFALGKRINGDVYLADLAKMPHLLVAGATGSGKSVGLNTMITSILYKSRPDEVKFIFIDPKRLELGMYADIPHLLTPIVTDAKMAANTLIWAVHEMEERYKLLAKFAVKDIDNFNRLSREVENLDPLPYIVVVIDELAELLSVAAKEVEICLQRLAQMARAVGIHLIIATQRPSVEVVTGVIKANFPSRISFRLLSRHDSKTILDTVGAEHLLGKGDMLFLPPNTAKLIRVHGPFISEEETKRIVDFLKSQQDPQYMDLLVGDAGEGEPEDAGNPADDPLYDEVARFVVGQRKASTSILQRRFRIGYGRAARLMDLLEEDGLVGEANGSRPREVLVPPDYFKQAGQPEI